MTEEELKKQYESLGFSNDFMFGKIMEDPEKSRAFLEQVLGIRIHHVEVIESEKYIKETSKGHGVRLDIYVDDGKTVYNCEMQTSDTGELPKRSRYYQSMIDSKILGAGKAYSTLKRSYVIFICTFDLFGAGRYIYTFENVCKEDTDIKLNDDAIKVFINTKGTVGEVSDEFKELLSFIDTSEDRVYNNSLANELLAALKDARVNEEWREIFMTWEMYGNDKYNQGLKEGNVEGYAKGSSEGYFNAEKEMIQKLLKTMSKEQVASSLEIEVSRIEEMIKEPETANN